MADTHSRTHASEERALERLVLFSDAVIAIVITLMVLEVKPPHVHGEQELLKALGAMWQEYVAVGVSFFVIGIFWARHHAHFRWVVRCNLPLVWMNLLFLLAASTLPFVTAVLAHNAGRLGTVIYAATVAITSILMGLMWIYTDRAGLLAPDTPAIERGFAAFAGFASAGIFLISIPVAFYDADLAKFAWVGAALIGLLRRAAKHNDMRADAAQ